MQDNDNTQISCKSVRSEYKHVGMNCFLIFAGKKFSIPEAMCDHMSVVANVTNSSLQLAPKIEDFDILKPISRGAFGKVFLTHNKHNPNHKVAIKVMGLKKLKDELDAIKEEVSILTKLDHPNIVKYYETYEDEKNIYLVMEYIGGGELFDKIAQQKN